MSLDSQIQFTLVDHAASAHLHEAARLHIEHLSYRSVITRLGSRFLFELYSDILSDKSGFFVFAMDHGKVCGFVLASTDSDRMFRVVRRYPFKYFKIILPSLFAAPSLLFKLAETFLYEKKENTSIKPELVVIVTDSGYRDKGIGSGLLTEMNKQFLQMNIHQYKVTVHEEMKASNNFYVKNGMKLAGDFRMYGVRWNMYVNSI